MSRDASTSAAAPSASTTNTSSGRARLVSAVLMVVLLAATGWPAETQRLVERDRVASCEAQLPAATSRAGERQQLLAQPAHPAVHVALPRPPHRQRRIDCGGLPPPRAPNAG